MHASDDHPPYASAEQPGAVPPIPGASRPEPYPADPPYGHAPQPGPAQSQYAPQPGPAQSQYAPPYPGAPAPAGKSGHGCIWWFVGAAVLLMLFSCLLVTVLAIGTGGSSSSPSFGQNTIAVIPLDGTIAGTGAAPAVVTPDDFLKLLQRAENDDAVRAIVLRVNSPGGTVAASEEISTYVKTAKKPVVVSVGDMDASGAYMVSSQADRIIANPGSAVGSIGVITEIPNASGLLDKLGIQFKVITAGQYKDAGSPYRSLTPSETAMIQGQVDQVYDQFIDIVASGRHLPRSQVASMATGWAWNGVEAKKLGLVDQIGTYKDSLDAAAKLGKIQGAYKTDVYESTQLSSILSSLLGIESQLEKISANSALDPASSGGRVLAK